MTIVDATPRRVREIENAWIPLADGDRLAARIWLPADAESDPVPAILEYLPYRKRDGTAARDALNNPYLAGHGYACVRVDMRGNGESDGLMWDEYLRQEQDDALEVLAWIAAQPWCTGTVGMMGISWGGFNGLQVAARRPPQLKAVVTLCSTDDRYADDIHYKGGCLLGDNLGWSATMMGFSSRPPDPALVGGRWRAMWLHRLEHLPHLAANWLEHQRRDDYWRHGSICEHFADVETPVFAVGGWADPYRNAIPRMLEGLRAPAKGLIGPWVHKYPHYAVPHPQVGFLQEALRWWDRWLKGIDTGVERDPALVAYLQDSVAPAASYEARAGRWLAEPAWPSPNVETRAYALNAEGLAETAGPEAALAVASPQTTGLACGRFCPIWLGPDFPTDQREDDAGSLVFDTAPLSETLAVLGAPAVELELAVDRPQANLAVRLCDVAPDGASTRISFGVLNLSHREGHAAPQAMVPGERTRVRLQLDDIGYAVPPGHRLRVAVSTAYWPMIWPAPEPVRLTVFAGAGRLLLPLRRLAAEEPEPALPAAESAPPLAVDELREAAGSRRVDRDEATGEVRLAVVDDTGARRIRAHGLEVGSIARETYTIHPDEPLSARAEAAWTHTLGRGDWRVRTETRSGMRAERESFHLWAELEAYEGERLAYTRSWRHSIPRDHL